MDQILKYFNAEKSESVLFVLVGILAIIVSTYFYVKVKQPFYVGMTYSLIAIGLIQITVGGTVYLRSPKDIIRVSKIVETDKSKIQTEEIPRMNTVMKNFALYKKIEILLLLIGLFMFWYFQPSTHLRGIGLGLSIQSGFMLLLDFFAENRGKTYLEFLENI